MELPIANHEDAMQSVKVSQIQADYIVTRNIRDFTNSPTLATTSGDLLKRIERSYLSSLWGRSLL